jgi:hypothetical protein
LSSNSEPYSQDYYHIVQTQKERVRIDALILPENDSRNSVKRRIRDRSTPAVRTVDVTGLAFQRRPVGLWLTAVYSIVRWRHSLLFFIVF